VPVVKRQQARVHAVHQQPEGIEVARNRRLERVAVRAVGFDGAERSRVQPGAAGVVDEDLAGKQVAGRQALFVKMIDRPGELDKNFGERFQPRRFRLHPKAFVIVEERFADGVFGDQNRQPVLHALSDYTRERRMKSLPQRLQIASDLILISRGDLGKRNQDAAVLDGIKRFIHLVGSAAGDAFAQFESAQDEFGLRRHIFLLTGGE
jgi:hypothetical protein